MKGRTIDENTSLFSLTWPIFVEILLYMLIGNIDTIMLSRYSDNAVAAIGNANQIMSVLIIMFNVVAISTGIILSQYLGANNRKDISVVYSVAVFVNMIFSFMLSIGLVLFNRECYELINLPQSLMNDAISYTNIVGGFLFIQASFMTIAAIFRSNGLMKSSMYVSIGTNIINIIGNYIFLFGPLGLPVLGIKGVAISSVFSRTIGLVVMLFLFYKYIPGNISFKYLVPFPKDIFKKMLKVGIPSAGEQISYNFSQVVIFSFINLLGTTVITTRMYSQLLVWFIFLASAAIGQANQIIVGHLVGAKKEDMAYSLAIRSLKISIVISISIAIIFSLFSDSLFSIFTDNMSMIKLGAMILLVEIFLEPGRAINIVIISSLRAAGDVKFPVIVGIVSMWGVSVLGAYVLGIKFQLGLLGIWIAMAFDEWVRGIIMLYRWKTGKWKGKRLTE